MKEHYPNFDWLRLLLAVQVVAIHADVAPRVFVNPVPAFLALSGFVVTASIHRNSIPSFFINRGLRVLPLLFLSFIAVGILYGVDAMWHNIFFWIWPVGQLPPNAVVWTLIYEEAFYALLAILFVLGLMRSWVFPALACLAIAFMTPHLRVIGIPWYFLGCAFFLGSALYHVRAIILRIPPWIATSVFAVTTAVMYSMPYMSLWEPTSIGWNLLGFVGLMIFGIAGPRLPKVTVDLSYSIYLIHCIVRGKLLQYMPYGLPLFSVMILCTLPISYVCWHLVERPALSLKHRVPYLTRLARVNALHVTGPLGESTAPLR
jgi:peptidoglycan/LPS O-acetylase OafA/YrhL